MSRFYRHKVGSFAGFTVDESKTAITLLDTLLVFSCPCVELRIAIRAKQPEFFGAIVTVHAFKMVENER